MTVAAVAVDQSGGEKNRVGTYQCLWSSVDAMQLDMAHTFDE